MALSRSKVSPEQELQKKYELCSKYVNRLNMAVGLMDLFNTHREMWREGLRSPVFGRRLTKIPCYNCADISSMSPDNVILGDIDGLWSNPIPVYEEYSFKFDSNGMLSEDYKKIVNQYRGNLLSGVMGLRDEIFDNGFSRSRLQKNLELITKDMYDKSLSIQNVVIDEKSLPSNEESRFITVSFDRFEDSYPRPDVSRRTSMILIDHGRVLVPEKFERGLLLDRKNYLEQRYADMKGSYPGKVSWVDLGRDDVKRPEKSQTGSLSSREYKQMARELQRKSEQKGFKIGF